MFQTIAGTENKRCDTKANNEKEKSHADADAYADISGAKKTPAESADQIDHRVDQGNFLPEVWQHRNGIKTASEERERSDDQQRNNLQFFKSGGPDANDETEQAEGDRGE